MRDFNTNQIDWQCDKYMNLAEPQLQFLMSTMGFARNYVRPILDNTSVIWNPSAVGLEDDIERIQRRFSKSIILLNSVSYDESLNFLGMETLKARRRYADLRFTYKVLHKIINIEPESVGLVRSQAPTRNHGTGLVVH